MGSTRRAFTPEYKEQSVAFVLDGGRPVAEVARNIGVHEMTLGKWVKVAREAAESGKNPDARLGESERTSRLVRSTSVPAAVAPFFPTTRSPSQCPGTWRSATSSGRS
jgi:transposase-like protein